MTTTKWFLICVTIVLSWTFVGCGQKAGEKPDPAATEQTASGVDPVDLDAVDGSSFDGAPCGNPDWSQLPPQSTAAPR